jgi:hypothetical protein
MPGNHVGKRNLFHRHSLSIISGGILLLWIFLYRISTPRTHIGSFFGNAIADWSGLVVMILATKYLYEKGSAESRDPPEDSRNHLIAGLSRHSLSLFLLVTGIGWAVLYSHLNSQSKWGEVVGNIVSEWTQILGLVFLTKRLIEWHSKESARSNEEENLSRKSAGARKRTRTHRRV